MLLHHEWHSKGAGAKLNWLRASVLGANDGIVSVASIVAGVAGASGSSVFILTAGTAGLVAGALSMAVGEYISVSTQRDTERALLEKERFELETMPEQEFEELVSMYEAKGMTSATARVVAKELTAHGAFAAHVDVELGIDPNRLTNPMSAALASAGSFFAGALVPLIAVLLSPASLRMPVMLIAVVVALAGTGMLSAYAGGANKTKATLRVVVGGILAIVITFGIGKIIGVVGGI
ncbi:MAG: VIT family protein [Candidatus Pacebacteria bacterium]|nr:VIT family protein [Candidatus Paceibacterota bacterium]MBP9832600.1 VIT family protein [Candidatus Paceibacterota bacterium]